MESTTSAVNTDASTSTAPVLVDDCAANSDNGELFAPTDDDGEKLIGEILSQHFQDTSSDESSDDESDDEFDYVSNVRKKCPYMCGVGDLYDGQQALSLVLSANKMGWLSPATEKTLQKAISVIKAQSKPRRDISKFLHKATGEAYKYANNHPDEKFIMKRWCEFL